MPGGKFRHGVGMATRVGGYVWLSLRNNGDKLDRQPAIWRCIGEHRRDLVGLVCGQAAADGGDLERQLRMLTREALEILDVSPNRLQGQAAELPSFVGLP